MRPADLPSRETLLERHPHGTRARYVGGGCRCADCRAANTAYERDRAKARRAGDWNGLVGAAPAKRHLRKLARAGIGTRTVADIAGTSRSIVRGIMTGQRKHLRARTLRNLLRVTTGAMTEARLVPAGATWRRLNVLLGEGFTKGELALRLGMQRAALQIRRERVTARTEARVARFYRQIMAGA